MSAVGTAIRFFISTQFSILILIIIIITIVINNTIIVLWLNDPHDQQISAWCGRTSAAWKAGCPHRRRGTQLFSHGDQIVFIVFIVFIVVVIISIVDAINVVIIKIRLLSCFNFNQPGGFPCYDPSLRRVQNTARLAATCPSKLVNYCIVSTAIQLPNLCTEI